MAETGANNDGGGEVSLKEKGNEFFKAGNYLKAAAVYTQAIRLDPSNATLYRFITSNRAAAFIHLTKLTKALADAEKTISLNPTWEKGYFRKGCVHEAMNQHDEALSAYMLALEHNPKSTEVSRKIKAITNINKEKKQVEELEKRRSSIDIAKHLNSFKSELCEKVGSEEGGAEYFKIAVEILESSIKQWQEGTKLDPKVHLLLDEVKTDTEKYAAVVNVDKAFESPHTHGSCFTFLRQYVEESYAKAACLVVPKCIIAYPQVWKGLGSRKWKHGNNDGFFVQFECPILRKLWFIPTATEKGLKICRNPEALDINAHEVFPRLFK